MSSPPRHLQQVRDGVSGHAYSPQPEEGESKTRGLWRYVKNHKLGVFCIFLKGLTIAVPLLHMFAWCVACIILGKKSDQVLAGIIEEAKLRDSTSLDLRVARSMFKSWTFNAVSLGLECLCALLASAGMVFNWVTDFNGLGPLDLRAFQVH
ncbi:hypothetical protein DRE_04176 [Drechslerella stenobrocha 248]|uniref:Uncharacterized protein n=1 Tax=Drechslerella stenobrocha 248 TaxID=1043628 RepID=W7HTI3_9PEZI|nr:hypothetical protein DRE_04176 [Drechslerella stenobrocha 248]